MEWTPSVRSFHGRRRPEPAPGGQGLSRNFARHASYFACEGVQLIRTIRILELQVSLLTLTVIFSEIAVGDRGRALLRCCGPVRSGSTPSRSFSVNFQVPATPMTFGLPGAGLRFSDFCCTRGHFAGESSLRLIDHRIDGSFEAAEFRRSTLTVIFFGQVSARDRRRHLRNVAHLGRQISRPSEYAVGEILPGPRDASAWPRKFLHFARDARDFRRRTRSAGPTIVLIVSSGSRISPRTLEWLSCGRIAARHRGCHLANRSVR